MAGGVDVVLAHAGDVAGAEAEARWCEIAEGAYLRGEHTYWRSAILAALGRWEEATRVRRQAYREGRSYTVGLADADFRPLWGYEPYEQLLERRG